MGERLWDVPPHSHSLSRMETPLFNDREGNSETCVVFSICSFSRLEIRGNWNSKNLRISLPRNLLAGYVTLCECGWRTRNAERTEHTCFITRRVFRQLSTFSSSNYNHTACFVISTFSERYAHSQRGKYPASWLCGTQTAGVWSFKLQRIGSLNKEHREGHQKYQSWLPLV